MSSTNEVSAAPNTTTTTAQPSTSRGGGGGGGHHNRHPKPRPQHQQRNNNNNNKPKLTQQSSGDDGDEDDGEAARQPQQQHRRPQQQGQPSQRSYQQNRLQSSNSAGGGRPRQPQHQQDRPKSSTNAQANNTTNRQSGEQQQQIVRRRLLSQRQSQSSSDVQCICCLHDLYTYVYYSCTHFVCLNCAVKMRVLCEKMNCPQCRIESPQVICTKEPMEASGSRSCEELFKKLGARSSGSFLFENDELRRQEYDELLANKCDMSGCASQAAFDSFGTLDHHMRRMHRRFYCELCLEHLKLFPFERKHYSTQELGEHKRKGDPDDTSFKGHPLCHHCDTRFFDRDELYRHFRKDHYFCHFCDTDGQEEYYRDYAGLRQHFLKSHYLCELDGCSSRGAETHEYVVFRTDVDFQAHKMQKHARTKNEAKALSKLNIEFTTTASRNAQQQQQQQSRRGRHTAAADAGTSEDDDQLQFLNSLQQQQQQQRRPLQTQTSAEQQRQRLRDQYELYDQFPNLNEAGRKTPPTLSDPAPAPPPPAPAPVAEKPAPPPPSAQTQQQQTWRNLVGQGSAPRDLLSEFPTLGGGGVGGETAASGATPFFSLAELGASISKSSAWAKKNQQKSPPQPKSSRREPAPAPSLVDDFPAMAVTEKKKPNATPPPKKPAPAKPQQQGKTTTPPTKRNDEEFPNMVALKELLSKEQPKPTQPAAAAAVVTKKSSEKKSNNKKTAGKWLEAKKSEFNLDNEDATTDSSDEKEAVATTTKKPLPPPPPGFAPSATTTTSSSINPPPGFAKQQATATTTMTTAADAYLKPARFEQRNKELIGELHGLFGRHFSESEFERFKQYSLAFRQRELSAQEYVTRCEKLIDEPLEYAANNKSGSNRALHVRFVNLIQEMIVLLPDVRKQHELYVAFVKTLQAYQTTTAKTATPKKAASGPSAWSGAKVEAEEEESSQQQLTNRLTRCSHCEQYFLSNELNAHLSEHHNITTNKSSRTADEDAFPALSSLPSATSSSSSQKATVVSKPSSSSDDFPPLSNADSGAQQQHRFGTMPTPALFSYLKK